MTTRRIRPGVTSVRQAAELMIQRHGSAARAGLVASRRADDTEHPVRHEFWQHVAAEIEGMTFEHQPRGKPASVNARLDWEPLAWRLHHQGYDLTVEPVEQWYEMSGAPSRTARTLWRWSVSSGNYCLAFGSAPNADAAKQAALRAVRARQEAS